MKQQTYGNIEQIVEKISLVTSVGVMEKKFLAPRASVGPDFDQIVIGSEGTLGVVTKVVVHVHKAPQVRRYGSMIFPDFERGTKFMYDVSQFKQKPSNIRLIDSLHMHFGQILQNNKSFIGEIVDFVLINGSQWVFRYDYSKACVASYLIEADEDDANRIEKKIKAVGWKYWGLSGGGKYGERAYALTFGICYLRVSHLGTNVGHLGLKKVLLGLKRPFRL